MEENILRALRIAGKVFVDHTDSTTHPDFILYINRKPFALEVKSKLQPVATRNWPVDIPEQDLFILDELTVRKMMRSYGLDGAVAVWAGSTYHLYTLLDLLIIPRTRVNRDMGDGYLKGKWLIRLSHAAISGLSAEGVIEAIERYAAKQEELATASPCYRGDLSVGRGGIKRTRAWRKHDYETTRPKEIAV